MRTKTKVVDWYAITVVALMMCAGCARMAERAEWREIVRNEVVNPDTWGLGTGHFATNIERTNVVTNNTGKKVDVYVCTGPFVQSYRIEGRKVFNCRWVDHVTVNTSATWESFWQLSKRLEQNETDTKPLTNEPVVTITEIGHFPRTSLEDYYPYPYSPERGFVTWSYWSARQWAGTLDKVPAEVEGFRKTIEQTVSAPEHVKNYRSYVRTVPLITKEALEAEKDTPLIDLKKTRYHVTLGYPYLLIPVPERRSPFPAVRNYTPGDKFKVQYEYNGKMYDYLIETFQGE